MGFALTLFPVVEGPAGRVALQGAERRLVEDHLQGSVSMGGALQVADLAGLLQRRGESGSRGQLVGGGVSGDDACHGEELRGEGGPHPGQALDEGRVRVLVEQLSDLAVESLDLGPHPQGFGREVFDDVGGDLLTGNADPLPASRGNGRAGQTFDRIAVASADAEQVVGDPGLPGAPYLSRVT